ncbi:MAG: cytochrome c [Burkholderiaceae bacterium]|nr:cytochrome c [Burkholderiaceae bacterium]
MNKIPVAVALAAMLVLPGCNEPPPTPPEARPVWLEQNWTAEQRQWYHHVSQGTATLPVPYKWFMALEEPALRPLGQPALFSSSAYLRRWGFIDSPVGPGNPGGLPVGFAIDEQHRDPNTGKVSQAIGLTCAACHTGQLRYKGVSIRIDGGVATIDLPGLAAALGMAVAFTEYVPGRFDRFARRLLGDDASLQDRQRLKGEVSATLAMFQHLKSLDDTVKDQSIAEGFTRLDALTRIGNQVFGLSADKPANYRPTNAPVKYPHVWTTPWFDWVQYNGSIMQPIVRNAGEALGVVASVNLAGPAETRFDSSVPIDTLHRIEQQLAGPAHPTAGQAFTGLKAPRWPEELLGAIDRQKAAKGQELYVRHCQNCHLPPIASPAFWDPRRWATLPGSETAYLKLKLVPISHVGTDEMQARALAERKVDTRGMGLNTTLWTPDAGKWTDCSPMPSPLTDGAELPYGAALGAVVQHTVQRWYERNNTPPDLRRAMDGDRPNCLNAAMAYKARPLDGIWAAGPFLHNGSVPDLMALLSPLAERPKRFHLGNAEFDPLRVGPVTAPFEGGFELDTTIAGNSNRGHEFDDAPSGTRGVIGPRLTPDERAALVEYLKSL